MNTKVSNFNDHETIQKIVPSIKVYLDQAKDIPVDLFKQINSMMRKLDETTLASIQEELAAFKIMNPDTYRKYSNTKQLGYQIDSECIYRGNKTKYQIKRAKANRVSKMKTLAHNLWGGSQHYRTIADGICWFYGDNTGGYIVDTDIYPYLDEYYTPFYGCRKYLDSADQHYAAFEISINAAKLEWLIPEIIPSALSKVFMPSESEEECKKFVKGRLELLETQLKKEAPEWLEKHPTPGHEEADTNTEVAAILYPRRMFTMYCCK